MRVINRVAVYPSLPGKLMVYVGSSRIIMNHSCLYSQKSLSLDVHCMVTHVAEVSIFTNKDAAYFVITYFNSEQLEESNSTRKEKKVLYNFESLENTKQKQHNIHEPCPSKFLRH